MSQQNDAEIVRAVLAGDKDRYALLIDRYSASIINYLARMTGSRWEGEELAQQTFVRAYFALDSYKPQYKFSTWLFKIATNLCINHLKKRQRLIHMDDYRNEDGESAWVLPDTRPTGDPVATAERREMQQQIQDAINRLPEEYRSAIILRYLHGLSYQEIAAVLDLPIGTVKSRIGRGRSRLIAALRGRV